MRIVSTLPSLTQICFALGLENALVGVSDYCIVPPNAKKIPRIGGIINPNYELVAALAPDIILMQDSDSNLVEKYKKLGYNTHTVRTGSIKDIMESILSIGQIAGKKSEAIQFVQKMQSEFDEVRANAKKREPVKTLLVIGHEPGSLREIYTAAAGSFHDELLRIAGGVNCIDSSSISYPKISKEEILKQSPQVIIVLSADTGMHADAEPNEKRLWEKLDYIDAVKKDAIYLLKGDHLFIPGPSMPQIARDFQKLLFKKTEAQ